MIFGPEKCVCGKLLGRDPERGRKPLDIIMCMSCGRVFQFDANLEPKETRPSSLPVSGLLKSKLLQVQAEVYGKNN